MLYSGWPTHNPLLDFFTRYSINLWLELRKNRSVKNKHSSAETTRPIQFVKYFAYMVKKGRRQRINASRNWSLGLCVGTEVTHTRRKAWTVNNGHAWSKMELKLSIPNVPVFKWSLYIMHYTWTWIVSAFYWSLHSFHSSSVQPLN